MGYIRGVRRLVSGWVGTGRSGFALGVRVGAKVEFYMTGCVRLCCVHISWQDKILRA